MTATLDHPAVRRVAESAARRGVSLEIRTFPSSTHTAEQAAHEVAAELGQIVKSLIFVASGDDGSLEPILCLVSGANRVDPGRLAALVGRPEVRKATAREANDLTGFIIGGIPPFGHERHLRVVMDPDLDRFAIVWAAAGLPNAVFPISPASLRLLADAQVAPFVASEVPPTERSR